MAKKNVIQFRIWSDAHERFKVVCKREGKTVSQKIREWILAYLKEHEAGNPQTTLVPCLPKDSLLMELLEDDTSKEMIPLERRRENMKWLENVVRKHPGKLDLAQLIHMFSRMSGLKPETVQDYVKTLRIIHVLMVRYGRVYTHDTLPPST